MVRSGCWSGHQISTHFSLSKSAGQIAGRILPAQSSSVNVSIVAANASKPAFRACTNGSLIDLVKAAISTLERV
jgi:hypothetical protein